MFLKFSASEANKKENKSEDKMGESAASQTVMMLSEYLDHVVFSNGQLGNSEILKTFYARAIPSIDILGYLSRILRYAPCTSECFLAVFILLQRCGNLIVKVGGLEDKMEALSISSDSSSCLKNTSDDQTTSESANSATSKDRIGANDVLESNSGYAQMFIVNSYNIHRLLIVGTLVAVKFMSDQFYTNVHISRT